MGSTEKIEVVLSARADTTGYRQIANENAKLQASIGSLTNRLGLMFKVAAVMAAHYAEQFIASSLEAYREFDYNMARVQVLTRETVDEVTGGFGEMREQVLELGETTMYSAIEVAKSFSIMAMAGLSASEIMATSKPMLDLATAGMLSIDESTSIAVDTMRAFGMEATQMVRITDAITAASVTSTIGITDIGESLKYVGPVARMAGWSIEEITAALGLMGQQGVKGSMAGMSLRMMIAKLVDPSRESALALKRLGIEVYNAQGQMNSLVEILRQMEVAGATSTDIFQIFGVRAGTAVAAMANKGSAALEEYTARIQGMGGITQDVAAAMENSAQGQWKIFQNQIVALKLALGEELWPVMKQFIDYITGSLIPSVRANIDVIKEFITKISDLAKLFIENLGPALKAMEPYGETVYGVMISALTWFKENPDALEGLLAALVLWKVYAYAAAAAQWSLNTAALSNPYVLLATGIAAAIIYHEQLYEWLGLTEGEIEAINSAVTELMYTFGAYFKIAFIGLKLWIIDPLVTILSMLHAIAASIAAIIRGDFSAIPKIFKDDLERSANAWKPDVERTKSTYGDIGYHYGSYMPPPQSQEDIDRQWKWDEHQRELAGKASQIPESKAWPLSAPQPQTRSVVIQNLNVNASGAAPGDIKSEVRMAMEEILAEDNARAMSNG